MADTGWKQAGRKTETLENQVEELKQPSENEHYGLEHI